MDLSISNPFQSTPSFDQFILASQNARHDDHLIVQGSNVLSLNKNYHLGDSEKKIYQRTWNAFHRAVKNSFSHEQIKHICSRYKFNLEGLKDSSLPFERRYLEYFGVGAASTYSYNLKDSQKNFSWLNWDLRKCSVETINNFYADATRHRYLGDINDPGEISGAPRQDHENWIQDYFRMDQQRCNLFLGIADLVSSNPNIPRLHPYYSRLSMAIASLLETKQDIKDIELVIPAPGATAGEVDYYKVYDVISSGGLTAVALVAVSDASYLKPIISFRCTKQTLGQTDAIPSILNDMEKHIGESGYLACEGKLRHLMDDPSFTRGKKPKVLCYSLGGGHAGYFMRDHWKEIDEFIGFNFVGNDRRVIEDLAEQINELPPNSIPPPIYIHRNVCNAKGTKGDWVNKSGQKHIGWGIHHPNATIQIHEWVIDDYPIPTENVYNPLDFMRWLRLHAARPMENMDKYRCNIYRGSTLCDPILDTYKRDRTLEDARQHLGHNILYRVVSFFYHSIDFVLRLFGIEFFRKNI